MDMLHSRYADPYRLMDAYIAQGRFGEFVTNIIEMDLQRKREAIRKNEDDRLWFAYILSMTDKSFTDWKTELMQEKGPALYSMTDSQVRDAKQQAKEILGRIGLG